MLEGQRGVRGPRSPPSSLDGIRSQDLSSLLINGAFLYPFPETPFPVCQPLQLYSCRIRAGISSTLVVLWSLLCRQSEIKDAASGLGVGARDVDDIFHSRRAASARVSCALARHIPQQRETPRVIVHQNESFMAHQKTMKCRSERSVRNVK